MIKQKNSINITPDDELLELIDKEAKDNMRTRKAQVEYIVKQYYKDKTGEEKWKNLQSSKWILSAIILVP